MAGKAKLTPEAIEWQTEMETECIHGKRGRKCRTCNTPDVAIAVRGALEMAATRKMEGHGAPEIAWIHRRILAKFPHYTSSYQTLRNHMIGCESELYQRAYGQG